MTRKRRLLIIRILVALAALAIMSRLIIQTLHARPPRLPYQRDNRTISSAPHGLCLREFSWSGDGHVDMTLAGNYHR